MTIGSNDPPTSRRGPARRGNSARPTAPSTSDAVPLLWSIERVALALSIGRRTLEREIAAGRFPKADVRIGKLNRWKPETVRDWIDRGA